MSESWKSFWLGTVTAVAIAIVAGIVLDITSETSGERFSSASTRLGE